jgi:hypothetical protein
MEIWKDVLGYEEFYEVSDLGNFRYRPKTKLGKGGCVIFLEGKHLPVNKNIHNYTTVCLTKDKISKKMPLHRVVYETFVSTIEKGMVINHINGLKNDNRLVNLEAITQSCNIIHAYKTGLITKSVKMC